MTSRARDPEVLRFLASDPVPMHIDGRWTAGSGGLTTPLTEPASGEPLCVVAAAAPADVEAAVTAATRAFEDGRWSRLRPDERSRGLLRLADLVERDREIIAELEVLQNGKSITEARGDVARAMDGIRFYAAAARNIRGETITVSEAHHTYTVIEPLGVVVAVVPWNVPLVLTVSKAAPALAAGNTVIVKPSQATPLTSLYLAKLWQEAGLPDGVYNVVTGPGSSVGEALCLDPRVTGITFTGSTETGLRLGSLSALQSKRTMLELGGKSPNIVLADADLDAAAAGAASAIFYGQGEICSAGSRLIVEDAVHDAIVERVVRHARALRIGDPLDASTQLGSLVSLAHRASVLERVAGAVADGVTVATGGGVAAVPGLPNGAFMEPTVLVDVPTTVAIAREEVFGPVLVVHRVRDAEEAIAVANDSTFGLGAGVWSRDVGRARRIGARLQSGVVWINDYNRFDPAMPFGGVKLSGTTHREWSHLGIDAFVEHKSYWERLP